jgi:hypothetical protein
VALRHILIADGDDLDDLYELCSVEPQDTTVPWIVPKGAAVGDECLISHAGCGLVGRCELKTAPQRQTKGHWKGRYAAEIGEVKALTEAISFEFLILAFPEWKWPTYPRMYVTPPDKVCDRLFEIARDFMVDRAPDIDGLVVSEGAPRLREHLERERRPSIVKAKRDAVLSKTGCLECEICGFDFEKAYGEIGRGFCEVHHLFPLGKRGDDGKSTSLEDLAIVCSNCHRMLHKQQLRSVESLRSVIAKQLLN